MCVLESDDKSLLTVKNSLEQGYPLNFNFFIRTEKQASLCIINLHY